MHARQRATVSAAAGGATCDEPHTWHVTSSMRTAGPAARALAWHACANSGSVCPLAAPCATARWLTESADSASRTDGRNAAAIWITSARSSTRHTPTPSRAGAYAAACAAAGCCSRCAIMRLNSCRHGPTQ